MSRSEISFEVLEYNGAGLWFEKLRHHNDIIDVCTTIAADIIHRVLVDCISRLDLCILNKGGYTEHVL